WRLFHARRQQLRARVARTLRRRAFSCGVARNAPAAALAPLVPGLCQPFAFGAGPRVCDFPLSDEPHERNCGTGSSRRRADGAAASQLGVDSFAGDPWHLDRASHGECSGVPTWVANRDGHGAFDSSLELPGLDVRWPGRLAVLRVAY